MTKAEINRKLDEIIDFSGCERYIDTPVKRYSSGMTVRLGFAVAAHLEPEILVVDEVLAVGDAEFQKKAIGKMQDVSKNEGRTVLFVSHNMGVMSLLCSRAMLIDRGTIEISGKTEEVINYYLENNVSNKNTFNTSKFIENNGKDLQLTDVKIVNSDGVVKTLFSCDEELVISLFLVVRALIPGLYGYLAIENRDGVTVLVSDSNDNNQNILDNITVGEHILNIIVPSRILGHGKYNVYLNFTSLQSFSGFNVYTPGYVSEFEITDTKTNRGNNRAGFISSILDWSLMS
jgi:lipopolysaccharide transport system ATP-binding protein